MVKKEKSSHKKPETKINVRAIAFIVAPFLVITIAISAIIYYYLPIITASEPSPSVPTPGQSTFNPSNTDQINKDFLYIDQRIKQIDEQTVILDKAYIDTNLPFSKTNFYTEAQKINIDTANYRDFTTAKFEEIANLGGSSGAIKDTWELKYQQFLSSIDRYNDVLAKDTSTVDLELMKPHLDYKTQNEGGDAEKKQDDLIKKQIESESQKNTTPQDSKSNKGKIDCDKECAKDASWFQKAVIYIGGANLGAPVCSLVCSITNGVLDILDFLNNLLISSTI